MADNKPDEPVLPEEQPQEEPQVEPEKKEESPIEESPETPEKESQELETEDTETEEPEAATEEETPQPMSRRKAKRLEKLEGLVERLRTPESTSRAKSQGIDYREMIQADDEVYNQLEEKSKEYGQAQFDAGLDQAKSIQFHTRLEIDAPKIETKYEQLNPESSEFNPVLNQTIQDWYLATVGYDGRTDTVQNAALRYGDFVEGLMELADNMAGAKSAQTTQNIAKQAASTGLRPDGSSATRLDLTKAPEQMTDEELAAVINQSLPKK